MPHKYTVLFDNVSVSAAQDLISLKCGASNPIRILRYWVGLTDTTIATSQSIRLRARYLPATVTQGSGGSTPTPGKLGNQTDPGSNTTAHANDTSQATTGGTAVVLDAVGVHIYNGYDSAVAGRDPIDIAVSAGFTWELESTVSGTVHLSDRKSVV